MHSAELKTYKEFQIFDAIMGNQCDWLGLATQLVFCGASLLSAF